MDEIKFLKITLEMLPLTKLDKAIVVKMIQIFYSMGGSNGIRDFKEGRASRTMEVLKKLDLLEKELI